MIPFVPAIAHMYKTDRTRYEATAHEWACKYAGSIRMVSKLLQHSNKRNKCVHFTKNMVCNLVDNPGNSSCGKTYHKIFKKQQISGTNKHSEKEQEESWKSLTELMIEDSQSISVIAREEFRQFIHNSICFCYSKSETAMKPAEILIARAKHYADCLEHNEFLENKEKINPSELLHTIMNLSIFWSPNILISKDFRKLLDPRIKKLSFISDLKVNAVKDLLYKSTKEMSTLIKADNNIHEYKQSQERTSSILANLKKPVSTYVCRDY
ncbi:unnamed protein product [Rhizophagus irregularis]|nr:unnamed protein product [Rhizophagus irregularis]